MRIIVIAKPQAQLTRVEKVSDKEYKVSVPQPAQEGRANKAIIHALADYFDLPENKILLIRGEKAKQKIFEIQNQLGIYE